MSAALSACLRSLSTRRFPLSDEKRTQAAIAAAFDEDGIAYLREHRLSQGDIVDFFVSGVAVEIKLAGAKRAIHRQCVRYCAHGEVDALILATNRTAPLPDLSKPTHVVNLGRAWL